MSKTVKWVSTIKAWFHAKRLTAIATGDVPSVARLGNFAICEHRAYLRYVASRQLASAGGVDGSEIYLRMLPPPPRRILVLGAGSGYEVAWLAERGYDAIGLTLLEEEAKIGHRRHPRARLLTGDMHDLTPFTDASFDLVYARETLEHSPALPLLLGEISFVLKPGGELWFTIPSERWDNDPQHFSCLREDQLRGLLPRLGYQHKVETFRFDYGDFFITYYRAIRGDTG